jgi:hypothetical protein
MVALVSKTSSFGSTCGQGAISGDDGRKWAGDSMTEHSIIPPLFQRDILLEQRISLLERLAECANEIKRIDEKLRLINAEYCGE